MARVRHPLRRWDASYFPDLFPGRPAERDRPTLATSHLPEARAEARILALRRSLEAKGARPTPARVQELAEETPAWSRVADALGLVRVPPAEPVPDERVVIPMYALVKFLEFPLQGWARFRVGLDEAEDDDVLARESEPFETDVRDETLLLRDVLLAAREGGSSLEQAYDSVVRERELRGSGPSGVFARGERDDHLNTLQAWSSELRSASISLEEIGSAAPASTPAPTACTSRCPWTSPWSTRAAYSERCAPRSSVERCPWRPTRGRPSRSSVGQKTSGTTRGRGRAATARPCARSSITRC